MGGRCLVVITINPTIVTCAKSAVPDLYHRLLSSVEALLFYVKGVLIVIMFIFTVIARYFQTFGLKIK